MLLLWTFLLAYVVQHQVHAFLLPPLTTKIPTQTGQDPCNKPKLSICDKCTGNTKNPDCDEHEFGLYCYREIRYTNHGIITTKSAANLTYCENNAHLNTDVQSACRGHNTSPGTVCVDCCFMSSCHISAKSCNSQEHIPRFISSNPSIQSTAKPATPKPTTTKPTTPKPTTPKPTTPKPTTTTPKPTTTTPKPTVPLTSSNPNTGNTRTFCQKCTIGHGHTCTSSDYVECPDDEPYCQNTFMTFVDPKDNIISKRCASAIDCRQFSLDLTAHRSRCSPVSGFPTKDNSLCHYCCKTALGDPIPCNTDNVPITTPKTSLATKPTAIPSTVQPTSSTASTTTEQPTTTKSTHKTTHTQAASTTPIPTTHTVPTTTTTPQPTTTTLQPTTTTPQPTTTTPQPTTTTPAPPSTAPPTLCPDNINVCADDPDAISTCVQFAAFGFCNNNADLDLVLSHCPAYCGKCKQFCESKAIATTTTTVAPTVYHCTDPSKVCMDNPHLDCKSSIYCIIPEAVKYCPVSCGLCDSYCNPTVPPTTGQPFIQPSRQQPSTKLLTTTTAKTSTSTIAPTTRIHCANSSKVCADSTHLDCKSGIYCRVAQAVQYCPVSCGLCDDFCNPTTTKQPTTWQLITQQLTTSQTATLRPTSQLPTTQPPPSTTTVKTRNVCHVCTGPTFLCERLHGSKECSDSEPYCINRLVNNVNGTRTVTRSCATQKQCQEEWWERSSNDINCAGYDPNLINAKSFKCSFCCIGQNCNIKIVPDNPYIGSK